MSTKQIALRDIDYAMSLAITLLGDLDAIKSRLKNDMMYDGRYSDTTNSARCPPDALALNRAVEKSHLSVREVRTNE